MRRGDLPQAVAQADAALPRYSEELILDHFRQKYPTVMHEGREVFLFTNAREFGANKHIVSLHGSRQEVTPEHVYQYVLITYCYSGRFRMGVDNQAVTLERGDCLVADRLVPHGVLATGPDDIAVNIVLSDRFFQRRVLTDFAHLHVDFAATLATPGAVHTGYRVYRTAEDDLARDCVERILCEHLDPRLGSADLVDDFCAALLTHLFRTYEPIGKGAEEDQRRSELMGIIRGYIEQNYADGNLGNMAQALGYEPTYLSGVIRNATGSTFKQVVNEERMRHATALLQAGTMPVYDVARQVGISNLTQFYKRFREYAGCTPQEYRSRAQA